MSDSPPEPIAYIELSFRPNVELISVVRRFVSDFYARVFSEGDATSRVALATHELLENAVRYSVDGETRIRVEVLNRPLSQVAIRTWNRTDAGHIAALEKLFAEMDQNEDAFGHYQILMRKSARIPESSGLGLARVRAEAEMALRYEISDGTLSVEAQTRARINS